MTRHYCDKCKNSIDEASLGAEIFLQDGCKTDDSQRFDLCKRCYDLVKKEGFRLLYWEDGRP